MDFQELIGTKQKFYGASENQFKLGTTIWEAVEDQTDGYRSMLEGIRLRIESDAIFFKVPVATVLITESNSFDFKGYALIDVEDGHQWLQFGTDECDNYYPVFVFSYTAKPPKSETLDATN